MKQVTKEGIRSSPTGDLVEIQHMPVRTEIGKESPELIMCRGYHIRVLLLTVKDDPKCKQHAFRISKEANRELKRPRPTEFNILHFHYRLV